MEAFSSNMLAIVQQTDYEHNCYRDNTQQFLTLMLIKVCLDTATLMIYCRHSSSSFLNMCSVSIVVADIVLMASMLGTLWLHVPMSHEALCFIMANFSAAYSALPIPIFCLGVFDYFLEDRSYGSRKYGKLLKNPALIVFMWLVAGMYAHATVEGKLVEQTRNTVYKVCGIRESKATTYSVVLLMMLMCFKLLPHLPMIPKWIKEADRISAAREVTKVTRTSDLPIHITTKDDGGFVKEEFSVPRPPMIVSLLLSFGVFWLPYLTVTTVCFVFEFGVPAYISVNLLWVQCVNSMLAGVVFWLRSDTVGPYSSVPDHVCLWQAYWQLSTETQMQKQLTVAMFNPSKSKESTAFDV